MKISKYIRVITLGGVLLGSNIMAMANPVNINAASANEIADNLNGIGLSRAQAVVDYRTEHGNFDNLQSLTAVKGIGQKTVDKNKDDIKFE